MATSKLRLLAILSLAGVLVGWVCWVHRLAGQPLGLPGINPDISRSIAPRDLTKDVGSSSPLPFVTNEECEPCHREIYEEWFGDQHAMAWFNSPLLVQDPKLIECNNCHAPLPVLETGFEKLPIIRTRRFEEGVGCIECHKIDQRVEGPRPSGRARCNPTHRLEFTESKICASCHAAHGSLAEWGASDWSRKGITCQACHMPLVDASVVTKGPPRRRRSHRMRSQRDPEVLREAVTMEARVLGRKSEGESKRVEIRLTNSGAGHNVPGEISNREMFLQTVLRGASGKVLSEHRESFKAPRRQQRSSIASTQLRSGETRVFTYDLGSGNGNVEIALGYKLLRFIPDNNSILVWEKSLGY